MCDLAGQPGAAVLRDFANDQRLMANDGSCHSHSIVPGGFDVMS